MDFLHVLRDPPSPHSDPGLPSLFELLSSTQLDSLLPPTLHHLLTIATRHQPRYLLPIYNTFDELYAILSLFIERHFLKIYSSTFVENFYALRRERVLQVHLPRAEYAVPKIVREQKRLTEGQIWKTLLVEIGGTYFKRKFDAGCEREREREALGLVGGNYRRLERGSTWKQKVGFWYRWFLRKGWPVLNALNGAVGLVWCLGYLGGRTTISSFWLWLVGTRIRRMGAADFRALAEAEAAKALKAMTGVKRGNLGVLSLLDPRVMGELFMGSLQFLLPTSIFMLKFLEWWHASDFARQLSKKAAEGLDLPPPIISGQASVSANSEAYSNGDTITEKGKGKATSDQSPVATEHAPPISASSLLPILTVPPPKSAGFCPICEKDIITPTACQTGYVYCYTCIHRWLEGNHQRQEDFMNSHEKRQWEDGKGRCAVSGKKVLGGTEGLRRIMI